MKGAATNVLDGGETARGVYPAIDFVGDASRSNKKNPNINRREQFAYSRRRMQNAKERSISKAKL